MTDSRHKIRDPKFIELGYALILCEGELLSEISCLDLASLQAARWEAYVIGTLRQVIATTLLSIPESIEDFL